MAGKEVTTPYVDQRIRRPFNVWRFRGVSTSEEVIKAKVNDGVNFQSEYCTILWSGMAFNADDAMSQYLEEKGVAISNRIV